MTKFPSTLWRPCTSFHQLRTCSTFHESQALFDRVLSMGAHKSKGGQYQLSSSLVTLVWSAPYEWSLAGIKTSRGSIHPDPLASDTFMLSPSHSRMCSARSLRTEFRHPHCTCSFLVYLSCIKATHSFILPVCCSSSSPFGVPAKFNRLSIRELSQANLAGEMETRYALQWTVMDTRCRNGNVKRDDLVCLNGKWKMQVLRHPLTNGHIRQELKLWSC